MVFFGQVSTVGKDGLVIFVYKVFEHLRVVDVGCSRRVSVDQLGFCIHFCVVLIAVMRLVVLLCPTSITVFLATFGSALFKACRAFTCFNLFVLLTRVALPRGCYEAGVHQAAFFGQKAVGRERLTETLEKACRSIALIFFKKLFKISNGACIRNMISGLEA